MFPNSTPDVFIAENGADQIGLVGELDARDRVPWHDLRRCLSADTQMAQDGQLPVYRALPHTVGDAPLDVLGNHDRGNASDIDRA
ncbi:MAG: hypothetical protein AB7V27_12525, partial [Candidatus Binatia bacterium]